MRIAICEDEKSFRDALYNLIHSYFSESSCKLTGIAPYINADALLHDYKAGTRFDVIFMDIRMRGISGMDAAAKIRQIDSRVMIIFLTSFSQFMPNAFQVEAFDYLVKPVDEGDLAKTLHRCLEKYRHLHHEVAINTSDGLMRISLEQVVYLESHGKMLTMHFNNGRQIEMRKKISDAEKELSRWNFVRCHQSYIVNLAYVIDIKNHMIRTKLLVNSKCAEIPVSRSYMTELKRVFMMEKMS